MYEYTKRLAQRLSSNEQGATAIEYGLIAAIVALGIIAGTNLISDGLDTTFTDVKTGLDTANGAG